jgi:hypothetical protein
LVAWLLAVAGGGGAGDELVPTVGPIRMELEETFDGGAARVLLTMTPAAPPAPCGKLVAAVDRAPAEIRITIRGIQLAPVGSCRLMEPPPASATIDLTGDTGRRRLILRQKAVSETFALEITDQKISIEPVGSVSVGDLASRGTLLRAPPRTVWVQIWYPSDAARKRFRPQAADLVAAIEAAGGRRFMPPAGRYAPRANAWRVLDPTAAPSPTQPPPALEYHYFTYGGRFEPLAAIGARFKKYDRRSDRPAPGPYMSVLISGWQGRDYSTR